MDFEPFHTMPARNCSGNNGETDVIADYYTPLYRISSIRHWLVQSRIGIGINWNFSNRSKFEICPRLTLNRHDKFCIIIPRTLLSWKVSLNRIKSSLDHQNTVLDSNLTQVRSDCNENTFLSNAV